VKLWLRDAHQIRFGYKHFLVETPANSYQGVELDNGSVVVVIQGRIGSYSSIEELRADMTALAVRQKISMRLSGDYNESLVEASIVRVDDPD
jgi:hypothetical protein